MTRGNRVCKYIWISRDCMTSDIYITTNLTTTAITRCVSHRVYLVFITGFVRDITLYTTQIALNNVSTVFFDLNSLFRQTRVSHTGCCQSGCGFFYLPFLYTRHYYLKMSSEVKASNMNRSHLVYSVSGCLH